MSQLDEVGTAQENFDKSVRTLAAYAKDADSTPINSSVLITHVDDLGNVIDEYVQGVRVLSKSKSQAAWQDGLDEPSCTP